MAIYRLDRPDCHGYTKEQRIAMNKEHKNSTVLKMTREYEQKMSALRISLRNQEQMMAQILQIRAHVKEQLKRYETIFQA